MTGKNIASPSNMPFSLCTANTCSPIDYDDDVSWQPCIFKEVFGVRTCDGGVALPKLAIAQKALCPPFFALPNWPSHRRPYARRSLPAVFAPYQVPLVCRGVRWADGFTWKVPCGGGG